MNPIFDVAIVGFGPSGAVAALLLGQAGLNVHVCDAREAIYDKPRAVSLDHEILRVFDQVGVLEQVEPWMEPFTDSEYLGVDAQVIKIMTTVAPPYPMAYPPSVVFSQPALEQVLRDRVAALTNVEVALGLELVGITQQDDAVSLQLRAAGDGSTNTNRSTNTNAPTSRTTAITTETETETAAWTATATPTTILARHVIGCDGASSRVRGLVGIALEDLGFDEPWLVIDVLANARGLARLPKVSMQYCEPERPCSYVIGPKSHRRWEISLKPGEDPQAMATPEGAWKALARWIGPDDGQLWRQASYRFHALVAERWRVGRVFIAGDAAHQQPPFLGQGLCQGVRDVANLCWKLVAVHEGRAGEALLDSYGIERKRHVEQLTARIKGIGAVICERDLDRARARDAALLAACGGVVRPEARQNVQPRLLSALLEQAAVPSGGCIQPSAGTLRENHTGDAQAALGDEADLASAAVGTLFPQPWVVDGTKRVRLDRLTGTGWRIVTADASMGLDVPAELVARLSACTIRIGGSGPLADPLDAPDPAPRKSSADGFLQAVDRMPSIDASAPSVIVQKFDALQPAAVCTETDGVLVAWFREHGCAAAIVRPDHYVHAVAANRESLVRKLSRLCDGLGTPAVLSPETRPRAAPRTQGAH